jgi:hypothetical protein
MIEDYDPDRFHVNIRDKRLKIFYLSFIKITTYVFTSDLKLKFVFLTNDQFDCFLSFCKICVKNINKKKTISYSKIPKDSEQKINK